MENLRLCRSRTHSCPVIPEEHIHAETKTESERKCVETKEFPWELHDHEQEPFTALCHWCILWILERCKLRIISLQALAVTSVILGPVFRSRPHRTTAALFFFLLRPPSSLNPLVVKVPSDQHLTDSQSNPPVLICITSIWTRNKRKKKVNVKRHEKQEKCFRLSEIAI